MQGVIALTLELKQINDLQAFILMDADSLTEEENQKAIPSLVFFTEKRCGTVRARECANGSKQREYTKKEDAASLTVPRLYIYHRSDRGHRELECGHY